MTTVGAYEAKTRFSQLIERVIQGERIVITRHGTPVAILQPIEKSPSLPLQQVISALKIFCRGRLLNGPSVRELIEEGRK